MLLNCCVGEDSQESLGLQGEPTSPSKRKSVLNIHWKEWCWSWNSNTLATWCEVLTHLKRPWCWERLKAGGEGDDRGWDGCMASPTQWTWVWVNSESWWCAGSQHGSSHPWQRSCGEAWYAKASQDLRASRPGPAWASTPKPESVCFTILWLSPTPLTLTGGYPRPPFSEGNQLKALVNEPPGHNRSV